jgi:hypothetical protein
VTGRSAAIQGGLAALGLLAAHLTWQREPERGPGEAVVIDASKSDVTRIRYEDADNVLGLERMTENGEPGVWVHIEPKAPAPKKADAKSSDAKASKASEAKTTPPAPPRDVRGNADALKLADRFAPLVSPRAFGALEGAKLKELGLDAPTRRLEVVVRGDTRKYDVGIALNAQNGEAFLRDARDGRIYLMPRQLLSELANSKRLVDPRLHLFESRDFDTIALTLGGKRREWIHLGRENFTTDAYASPKTPDKHDQMAKNWADELWRTFPSEVLGKDELPKGGAPKVSFRVDYTEKGKPVGWIEIARGPTGPDASDASPSPGDNIYARSEHSVGWSRLHSGDLLITDAEKLVAVP